MDHSAPQLSPLLGPQSLVQSGHQGQGWRDRVQESSVPEPCTRWDRHGLEKPAVGTAGERSTGPQAMAG